MNRNGALFVLLFAVIGYFFFLPEEGPTVGDSDLPPRAEDSREVAETDDDPPVDPVTEQEPQPERVEVVEPESQTVETTPNQLVIHGKAISGEVAIEDMLVRLVIFDFEPGRETRFQYNDPSTWENASRTLFSKPRPVDADGSFVLSGNPPVPIYEGRRRYAVVISMDVGGNGIPMRDGESIIPLAMSAMLVGDEHPEESPLLLEVPRPYQVTIEAHFPPELTWSLPSQLMEATVGSEAPFVASTLMSVATETEPKWTTSVSRLLTGLKFSYWAGLSDLVNIHDSNPPPIMDSDLTLAVSANAMGHLVARAPFLDATGEPSTASHSGSFYGVQYRILPLIDDQSKQLKWPTGWQHAKFSFTLDAARDSEDIYPHVRHLVEIMNQPDLRERLHRALIPYFVKPSDEDSMTYFNAGWIHEGQVELEIKDPQGGIWTSGPITIRSGDSLIVDMTRVDQHKLVTFALPPDLIAYRPQDARFVFDDGRTEGVNLQREGVPSTGHWVWKTHVPPRAKQLIARGIGKEPHHVRFVTATLPETLPDTLAFEVLPTHGHLDLPEATSRTSSFYMGRTGEPANPIELRYGGMRLHALQYSEGLEVYGLPPGSYGVHGFVTDEAGDFIEWQGHFTVQ